MAFKPNEHYGQCMGGPLHGCVEQGGKFYRMDGTEVDKDAKPVKVSKTVITPPPEKKAEEPDTQSKQLAAQLNG